eukprot:m.44453 g.44453  ORF g.44453 m.44453 type:complete len:159 (+) comp19681_c0_seq1:166-642(+)
MSMANISDMWTRMRLNSSKRANNSKSLSSDLLPTQTQTSDSTKCTSLVNDTTHTRSYNNRPKLVRVVRNNPNTPIGMEFEACDFSKNSKKDQMFGLRVAAVWVGSVANMCGLREDDVVVGVNNTTWNDRNPKKSAQRLRSEILNTKLCSMDLMVLTRL